MNNAPFLATLVGNVKGVISFTALTLFTLYIGPFLFALIILRFILPNNVALKWINPNIVRLCSFWVNGVLWWINRVQKQEWDIQSNVNLSMDQWYLTVSNHQSWADIFALYQVSLYKMPMAKFFIKKQLMYIPIVGQAWWALDYPFMSRYSKAYLAKHPEKAGSDLAATKKACEKFSYMPTTVVNYLEGTRFTSKKHQQTNSPYEYLLPPKAGGIAFAIQALGKKFNTLIDVTVHYHGKRPGFWEMLSGNVAKITVLVDQIEIPEQFVTMDYGNNIEHKENFKQWIHNLWLEKDKKLATLNSKN